MLLVIFFFSGQAMGIFPANVSDKDSPELIQRIVVGSCLKQNDPQPCWNTIRKENPDLMVLCGDSIYADTYDIKKLAKDWNTLATQPDFVKLRSETQVIGTWDDHDYGDNDGDGGDNGDEGDDRGDGDDHDGGDQIAFQRGPQPSLPPRQREYFIYI